MLLSFLQKRRSIRRFTDQKVETEKIDALIEAALRAPSGKGIYPCEFMVVTDAAVLDKISLAKDKGSAFIKNAPLGIVICADPDKTDIWIEDASIASTIVLLAAESLGLGACWIQIRKRMHDSTEPAEPYITELLNLPKNLKVLSMIAIGYPAEEKAPHPEEKLQFEKIHRNIYGGR